MRDIFYKSIQVQDKEMIELRNETESMKLKSKNDQQQIRILEQQIDELKSDLMIKER